MRRSGVRIPLAPPQADIRSRMSVFCMPGRWCGACCRWCSGRRRARPPARLGPHFVRRVVSKPGQAPPPPTGTAAWPSVPSGALHTGGTWCTDGVRSPARPHRRPPALRPGPAAAHRHGARVSAWTVTVAFNVARANLVCDFRQVLFIAILRRLHFAVFECVSPTGWLFRKGDVMVGDTWRQFPRFDLWMSLVTRRAIHGCE